MKESSRSAIEGGKIRETEIQISRTDEPAEQAAWYEALTGGIFR